MPEFNADEYFARVAQANAEQDGATNSKYLQLQQAAQEKIANLNTQVAEGKRRDLANANSWVGKLGLDDRGLTAQAVNLGASVYSGSSRLAGDIIGLAAGDIEAMIASGSLSEPQIAAISRYKQGVATPEEVAMITARPAERPGEYSPLEMFDKATAARQRSEDINASFDRSDAIHVTSRERLSDQLGENFGSAWDQTKAGFAALTGGDSGGAKDLASGVAKLIYNAGEAAVTNPVAASEYIAENAPQLLIGTAGKLGKAALTASNVGYASEYYQKGLAKYQAENNGAYPPEAQRQEMAMYAASLALAEHVSDLGQLKLAKGAAEAVEQGGKTGLMQSLKNTAKAALGGALEESATEGYQSFAEGKASLTPVSAEEIYEGAVIGGLAGGGMSGGGRALGEVLKATPEHAAERAAEAAREEVQKAAIASGDVTALADPKNSAYDPAAAIAALNGNASKADATPEAKQANLEKASQVVAELEARKERAQAAYDLKSPEGLKAAQDKLADLKAQLAAVDQADTDKKQLLTEMVEGQQAQVDEFTVGDAKTLKKLKQDITTVDDQLSRTRDEMARFHEDLNATEVDVTTQVEAVKTGDTAAADKLITLSMAAPERVSSKQAEELANSSALNEAQRTYWRSFSAARVEENKLKDMDDVSQEIYSGGRGNIGISQYRAQVTAALAAGNQALAEKHLAGIKKFEADHQAKAVAARAALKQGMGNFVLRAKDGRWFVTPSLPKGIKNHRVNGGLQVNSGKLVANVRTEAGAITAARTELEAAIALKKGGSSVQNVQEAPAATQAVAAGQASQGDSTAANPAGSPAAAAPRSPDVEAAGVAGSREPESTQQTAADTAEDSVDSGVSDAVGAELTGEKQSTNDVETSSKPSTEVASESAASPESAEQTSVAEEPSAEDGKLSVLGEKSAEDTPYQLRNLIAEYFTQSSKNDGDKTPRPLVAVKDFYDALKSRAVRVTEFLIEKAPSEKQREAVLSFLDRFDAWQDSIRANLPKRKDAKYRNDDMMQFLLTGDETSDVDQNVKIAIAYAVYSWVVDSASAPVWSKPKSINSILLRDKKAPVSPAAYKELGRAGEYQHQLIDSLGGRVMEALGLKASADASQDLEARLRMALGTHALKLAEDKGLAKRTMIPGWRMQELREEGLTENQLRKLTPTNPKIPHFFFAVARNQDGSLVRGAHEISQANTQTQGILGKLFGVEGGVKLPSLEPITDAPANTSGTKMEVPGELRAIELANQSRERKVRQDTLSLLDQFDEDDQHAMMGVVEEENFSTHMVNRSSVLAKNDGLRREWRLFREYVGEYLGTSEKGLDTPIYLPFSVWKQQRVGIASTAVNPQTSKIHRFLLGSPAWTTKIDPADTKLMNSFWLRVGEGLGVKTERADNEVSIQLVQGMLKEPVYANAIAALVKSVVQKQQLSAEEKTSIVEAVAKGEANLHTLDALIGVARQQAAIDEKGKQQPFTVQMMGEVDGVANGTILNHILLGAADTAEELNEFLQKGGIYQVGDEHSQYNQWYAAGGDHLDVYQDTAKDVYRTLAGMFKEGSRDAKKVAAIWSIAGDIFNEAKGTVTSDGRNLVKDALNPLAFGSSLGSIVNGMSDAFIEKIYKGFEKLSVNGASQEEVATYVGYINALIPNKADHLSPKNTIEWHMEHALPSEAEAAIRSAFGFTVGKATTDVVKAKFAPFLARRNALNQTTQKVFGLYDAVYRGMREAYIEELVAKGELPVNAKGERIADLSKKQEAELEKRLRQVAPVIRTSMSKGDKGKRSGLRMAKTKRGQSDDPTYVNETQFGTPLSTGRKQIETSGMVSKTTDPGVAMGSATTHSTDSAISHRVQRDRDVLNIHDALGDGVGGLEETARALNRETWNAMLDYSSLDEAYRSLASVVWGIAKMVEGNKLSPQAVKHLQDFLSKELQSLEVEGLKPQGVLEVLLAQAKQMAYDADRVKYGAMKTWAAVDQYASQGGNYEVTDKDRAEAAKREAELTEELSTEDQWALKTLAGLMSMDNKATKTAAVERASEELLLEAQEEPEEFDTPADTDTLDPIAKPSPYGVPSTKKKASSVLETFLRSKPEHTAKDVIKQLAGVLDRESFAFQLLKALNKAIDPSLVVKLVTPQTPTDAVLAPPEQKSLGWFVSKGSQQESYILSTDWEGVTPEGLVETVLHELTHGALVRLVESAKFHGEKSPAHALVKELEQLRSLALAYAKQQGITKWNGSALKDVHELIAWGMNNQEFQDTILKQVSMQSKTQGGLVNGMKAFIEKLVGLLFQGSSKPEQERAMSGMAALVGNVTQLFAQAAQVEAQSGTSIVLSQAADPMGTAQAYSTLDLHAALDATGVTPEFDAKLRNLLGGIVHKLHGPWGAFKDLMSSQVAATPFDAWQKALDTGRAPFASLLKISPIAASEQELHAMEQVEAVVQAALDSKDATTTSAYRELVKLFEEARRIVKPADFASQDEYDFLFKVELGADGRSGHLARFAAFGLAHQQVNQLLQRSTALNPAQGQKSFADRIQSLFERLLEWFHSKLTRTYAGQQADQKLEELVRQLVDIEAKKKTTVARRSLGLNAINASNAVVKGAGELARGGLLKVAGSGFVRNNRFETVKAVGTIARALANDQVEGLIDVMGQFRERHFKGRHGFVMGILSEYKGPGQVLNALQLASTNQQRERKQVISHTENVAMKAFAEGGRGLTKLAKHGITQVFLRSGLHALLGPFNMAEIEQLVASAQARDAAIASLVSQLGTFGRDLQEHFNHKANYLGFYKAQGKNRDALLMMNAHNIAMLYGTTRQGSLQGEQLQQAEKVIEQLVALYALRYSAPHLMAEAKEVIRTENARTDGNGVELVLALHKRLEQESKDRIFQGQQALMQHGYTPEIYNPHTEVLVATDAAGKQLELMGYKKVGPVELDAADPDRELRSMYVLRDGGLRHQVTGSISYTGKNAKGSTKHSGWLNVNTADGLENASKNADIAHAKPVGLASGAVQDLTKAKGSHMAPVLNPQGDIVNWRYLMQDSTKDDAKLGLERDNRFEKVLGMLAGSIYDKETTTELNNKVLEALHEQYRTDKDVRSGAFIQIGPKSPDPELREIWRKLPQEAKDTARDLWGRDGIRIRKDQVTPVFGYRKYSLSEAFEKGTRNWAEQAMVYVVEHVLSLAAAMRHPGWTSKQCEEYAQRAAVVVAKSERIWQELVHEAKDIMVVKSGVVMLGNIFSNWSLLKIDGITFAEMAKGHMVALRGARAYQHDSEKLAELQAQIDTGLTRGEEARIRREIAQLEDALNRNPVKELIDAGLMPTIVEDVAQDDDIYSYKSALVRKVDKLTEKLPGMLVTAGKNVLMTHDTKAYQGLSRLTQLSDFAARYTMYQHLTTRAENPLSKEDAIFKASEAFINYDVPMHKGLQYMDDMGFMMFNKYFLRIQRVLAKQFAERPAQVLTALLLDHTVGLGPIVLESGWAHKIGNNPLRWGAFELPGTLDELATLNAGMALIK